MTCFFAARELFTFEFIKDAIRSVYPNCFETLLIGLVRLLAFDAVVGNNDRHFYNWGIIDFKKNTTKLPTFAPIYDSARGLYWAAIFAATQELLLELLKKYQEYPLTIRELQEELTISSPSVIYHHIQQLEKKGYLKRNPHNPKDYSILSDPDKPIVYLNQYGFAQCGPSGSILDGNPIDRVPIASRLLKFPAEEAFLVEAKGDSMEPKIYSGDLIIARKQNHAESGDIIVCVNNLETLIKNYVFKNDQCILRRNIFHF
ncbi:MAG: S24 family peptidase [Bacteroidota bacterium]|nr:S24 family peptidase [Bacteroidota bacterium]